MSSPNASPWVLAGQPSSLGDPSSLVTLVDGQTFSLSSRTGDYDTNPTHGVFFADMRVLKLARLRLDGHSVEPLAVHESSANSATFVGRHIPPGQPDVHLLVVRRRWVGTVWHELLELRNYGTASARIVVDLEVAADFADVFEIKEGHDNGEGEHSVAVGPHSLAFGWRHGAINRRAELTVDADGVQTSRNGFQWTVELAARRHLAHARRPRRRDRRAVDRAPPPPPERGRAPPSDNDDWIAAAPRAAHERSPPRRGVRHVGRRPRVAAAPRPDRSAPAGGGGRRAVVHDTVRARRADHGLHGAPRRSRHGARCARGARRAAGRRHRPRDRGGARPDRPRDAPARARRHLAHTPRPVLRLGRCHAAVRRAARRADAMGDRRGQAARAGGPRRPRPAVGHRLRRPRRRRVRRVPPIVRPRPREPGMEGLGRRHPVPRRPGGRGAARAVRGAGLRVRRVAGAGRDRRPPRRARRRSTVPWQRPPISSVASTATSGWRSSARSRSRSARTRSTSTRSPRTSATACGVGSSTTSRGAVGRRSADDAGDVERVGHPHPRRRRAGLRPDELPLRHGVAARRRAVRRRARPLRDGAGGADGERRAAGGVGGVARPAARVLLRVRPSRHRDTGAVPYVVLTAGVGGGDAAAADADAARPRTRRVRGPHGEPDRPTAIDELSVCRRSPAATTSTTCGWPTGRRR